MKDLLAAIGVLALVVPVAAAAAAWAVLATPAGRALAGRLLGHPEAPARPAPADLKPKESPRA